MAIESGEELHELYQRYMSAQEEVFRHEGNAGNVLLMAGATMIGISPLGKIPGVSWLVAKGMAMWVDPSVKAMRLRREIGIKAFESEGEYKLTGLVYVPEQYAYSESLPDQKPKWIAAIEFTLGEDLFDAKKAFDRLCIANSEEGPKLCIRNNRDPLVLAPRGFGVHFVNRPIEFPDYSSVLGSSRLATLDGFSKEPRLVDPVNNPELFRWI